MVIVREKGDEIFIGKIVTLVVFPSSLIEEEERDRDRVEEEERMGMN